MLSLGLRAGRRASRGARIAREPSGVRGPEDHPPPPAVPSLAQPPPGSGWARQPQGPEAGRTSWAFPQGRGEGEGRWGGGRVEPKDALLVPAPLAQLRSPGGLGGRPSSYQLALHRVTGKEELPVKAEDRVGGLATWPKPGWARLGAAPAVSPGPVRVWLSRGRSSAAAAARPTRGRPAVRQPLASRRAALRLHPPGVPRSLGAAGGSSGGRAPARAGRGLPGCAGERLAFAFSAPGKQIYRCWPRQREPSHSLCSRVKGQLPAHGALRTEPTGVDD